MSPFAKLSINDIQFNSSGILGPDDRPIPSPKVGLLNKSANRYFIFSSHLKKNAIMV